MSQEILARLTEVLEERKQADPEHSYVASLYKKGLDTILKKVGEECTETVIAAKNVATQTDKNELVYEMADLWFHSIVLLSQQGVHPDEILNELDRRFGLSGIEEKAQRNK